MGAKCKRESRISLGQELEGKYDHENINPQAESSERLERALGKTLGILWYWDEHSIHII